MRSKQQHIISKVLVEVDSNTSAGANDIRVNSNRLLDDSVFKVLDEYIAEIEPELKNWTVQLDRLDLDFSMGSGVLNEIESREAIRKQLDSIFQPILQQIKSNKAKSNGAVQIKPPAENQQNGTNEEARMLHPEMRRLKSVLHFLETGKAAWWIRSNEELREFLSEASIRELIESQKSELIVSLRKLFKQLRIRKRFARQFQGESLFLLLSAIRDSLDDKGKLTSKMLSSNDFQKELKDLSPSQRMAVIDSILRVFSNTKDSLSELNIWTEGFISLDEAQDLQKFLDKTSKELHDEIKSRESEFDSELKINEEGTTDSESDYTGLIAENAGLVMLNPFLKQFFSTLNLLDEDGSLNDPVLAAHLLHFLATGEEKDFEFALTFEAFLCQLPLGEPLPREVTLSKSQKEACHELLEAVLGHWKALKSKSIQLLRKEFLQRKGKLLLNETTPRIVVERGAIDILMDKLPWSISMLKLPWRDELIYVEW